MSKFDMIVELMVKNGVTTKFSESLFKNLVNDEPIIELDFSEHDKVFEDRIAKLEKENKALNSYLVQREQDSTDMIMKLKQRIAELESKETEKPTKVNLNDRIKVKLTPLGAEIYYHQYDDIHKDYPKMKKHLQSSLPKVDENGYTEFQLWHFMELYGEHIGMCKKNVISPLDIIIVE